MYYNSISDIEVNAQKVGYLYSMEYIESDKIEYKSKVTEDLEKEVVAFLNSKVI